MSASSLVVELSVASSAVVSEELLLSSVLAVSVVVFEVPVSAVSVLLPVGSPSPSPTSSAAVVPESSAQPSASQVESYG